MNGENLINLLSFLLSQTCEVSLSVSFGERSVGHSPNLKSVLSADPRLCLVGMVCKHPVMWSGTIWTTITPDDFGRVRRKLDYLMSMYPHHFTLNPL